MTGAKGCADVAAPSRAGMPPECSAIDQMLADYQMMRD